MNIKTSKNQINIIKTKKNVENIEFFSKYHIVS